MNSGGRDKVSGSQRKANLANRGLLISSEGEILVVKILPIVHFWGGGGERAESKSSVLGLLAPRDVCRSCTRACVKPRPVSVPRSRPVPAISLPVCVSVYVYTHLHN